MNYFKLLLLNFFILSFSACKEDDGNEIQDPKENMLTAKNWLLIAAVADPPIPSGETTVTDIFAFIPACSKDDISKFNADGTLIFDEGPTKCVATDPQTVTSNWSFNSEKTILTLTLDSETVSYKLIDISNTLLKVSFIETLEESDDDYTVTATYTAQ